MDCAWRTSLPPAPSRRGCHASWSTTVGGWRRRCCPPMPKSSPFRSRRQPRPRALAAETDHHAEPYIHKRRRPSAGKAPGRMADHSAHSRGSPGHSSGCSVLRAQARDLARALSRRSRRRFGQSQHSPRRARAALARRRPADRRNAAGHRRHQLALGDDCPVCDRRFRPDVDRSPAPVLAGAYLGCAAPAVFRLLPTGQRFGVGEPQRHAPAEAGRRPGRIAGLGILDNSIICRRKAARAGANS